MSAALPILVRIPHFDGHVVGAGKHIRELRVNSDASKMVRVRLEGFDLLHRIVIEHTDVEIIRASDDPLLPSHKLRRPYRQLGDLKGFQQRLRLKIPYMYVSIVQTAKHPGLLGVQVDAFHTIRPRGELPPNVEPKRH